jgi:Flp pilus assembly protein TadD
MKRKVIVSVFLVLVFGCSWISEENKSATQLHNEGLKHFRQGKYEKAIEVWIEESKLDPKNANTYNNIGIAYRKLGDLNAAVGYHKKALEVNPNFNHGYYSLGLVYYDRKEFEQARDSFLKAVALNYANADVYYSLGLAYKSVDDFVNAEIAFKKVVEIKPSFPGVHLSLGECYVELGKFDLARMEYQKETETNPSWASLAKEGIAKLDTKVRPDNPDAFFALGAFYKNGNQEEDVKKAFRAFLKAAELDPSHPDVHFELGSLYERQGDFFAAHDEYLKELEFHPRSDKPLLALQRLRLKMERVLDAPKISAHQPILGNIVFPQKGMVVAERADIYDYSYRKIGGLSKDEVIHMSGIHDRTVRRSDRSPYVLFYRLSLNGKNGLIPANAVVLESTYNHIEYISPSGRIQIVRNPVILFSEKMLPVTHFSLFLKVGGRRLVLLGPCEEGEARRGKEPICWSPDERYLFVESASKVFLCDGSMIAALTGIYTSPVWHGDMLLLRGSAEDDAVYALELETRAFKKFLDISEGLRFSDLNKDVNKKWDRVQIEKGLIKARFERIDLHPPDRGKHCMTIEVTVDQRGKIIDKDTKWDFCRD